MSRRHAGHFSAKHPADTVIDHTVMKAVALKMANHKIACKTAFAIAADLSVPPSTVGIAIDLNEGRIMACQLGLFGYGKNKKILDNPAKISNEVTNAINTALIDGCLPCEKAWQIAKDRALSRLEIARICESMGIRISRCQLGAF